MKIREAFIKIRKRIVREREELTKELEKNIEVLSDRPDLSGEELETLHHLRRELYSIMRQKEHLSYLRSRCRWARFGDKPSKFFLNLEKNNYSNKVISSLYDDENNLLVNPEDILRFEKEHFQDRYKITVKDSHIPDLFSSGNSGRLDDLERTVLDDNLSKEELLKALSSMKNGKSPGSDGIVVEFYKKFWHLLVDWLLESLNSSFAKGSLSPEQYRGIITLIPKKDKDRRFIKSWRPITLLNIDYKIFAKCMASRLGGVIPKLVSPDQTGFVAGRFIGVNLRNTQDIIDTCSRSEEGGLIVSLDYASAFDTLDRIFLSKALNSCNFGPRFIQWVDLMYSGAKGCVVNNGNSSGWFNMEAGLRQGCPASPLLFILAVEKFAHAIRQNESIKGISVNDNTYKVSQYADDTTLFIRDGQSLELALEVIDDFHKVSGLKLNIAKTQGLNVKSSAALLPKGLRIKWSDSIQVLGLTFYNSEDNGDRYLNDLEKYLIKMRERCSVWGKRQVSLKGKVVILNVLIYPILYYAASNLFFPERLFLTVKEVTRKFLWNGNRPKISLDTLTLPVKSGGLGLHDFAKRIKAARLAWVKRAIISQPGPWTDFLCERSNCMGVSDIFLRKNRNCPGDLPEFYKAMYREWQGIYNLVPSTDMACRSEPLWSNRNIHLRSLARLEITWREHGIRRINDILIQGRIMSSREFENVYGIYVQQGVLDKLARYIGRELLESILPIDKEVNPVGLYVKGVRDNQIDLGNMATKELYQVLMQSKKHKIAAKAAWTREFEDIEGILSDLNWTYWYSLPFSITREVRLQSFQFRVLHRTIPCNVYLQQIRVKESKTCSFCNDWDDLIHFFYYCPATVEFWDSVALWLSSNSETVTFPEDIEETDFLFGLQGKGENERRLNLILLYGRFYIYKQKVFNNGELDTYKFLIELKNLLLIEKLACIQEGTRKRKFAFWEIFFQEL